jgi:protein-disulfide isomerase
MDLVIPGHRNSPTAHSAASCAGAQGRFWEMHDQIYAHQAEWSALAGGADAGHPERAMEGYAKAIGLDLASYDACMRTGEFDLQIRANGQEGVRLGVDLTPTLIIGQHVLPGGGSYDLIKAYVDTATREAAAAAKKAGAAK